MTQNTNYFLDYMITHSLMCVQWQKIGRNNAVEWNIIRIVKKTIILIKDWNCYLNMRLERISTFSPWALNPYNIFFFSLAEKLRVARSTSWKWPLTVLGPSKAQSKSLIVGQWEIIQKCETVNVLYCVCTKAMRQKMPDVTASSVRGLLRVSRGLCCGWGTGTCVLALQCSWTKTGLYPALAAE